MPDLTPLEIEDLWYLIKLIANGITVTYYLCGFATAAVLLGLWDVVCDIHRKHKDKKNKKDGD